MSDGKRHPRRLIVGLAVLLALIPAGAAAKEPPDEVAGRLFETSVEVAFSLPAEVGDAEVVVPMRRCVRRPGAWRCPIVIRHEDGRCTMYARANRERARVMAKLSTCPPHWR